MIMTVAGCNLRHDGDRNGVTTPSGADAKCQADSNAPAGYTIKAVLSATGYNAKDVLPASKQTATVYRLDGVTQIAVNWAALWNATPFTNSVSSAGGLAWTGSNSAGTTDTGTCGNWTTGAGSVRGDKGATDGKDGTWMYSTSSDCDSTSNVLYCVAYQ